MGGGREGGREEVGEGKRDGGREGREGSREGQKKKHSPGMTCQALGAPSVQWDPGGGLTLRVILTSPPRLTVTGSQLTCRAFFPVNLLNGVGEASGRRRLS